MFLDFYQHLPEYINPIVFSIGFFSVRWYSLMYLVGLGIVYWILKNKSKNQLLVTNYQLLNLLFYCFIGLLIGGRLGYVLFYDLNYFIQNPLEIFLPFQITSYGLLVTGYYGMSYHGGLIGAILAGIIFARKYKINFWKLVDWIIPAIPAGYFFGRIGNFLNGELYGRVTDMPWGMYFNGQLRHPSQLYEAFFEGIILFVVLWFLRGKSKFPGFLFCIYLFGYGSFRFILEFFREPDAQIGFVFSFLTAGQILSAGMIILAVGIFCLARSSDS